MTFTTYTLSDIRKGLQNPRLAWKEAARAAGTPVRIVRKHQLHSEHGRGIDVMDADWDNLIILDACRYDYFADQNTITGSLSQVVSKGSQSWEFMEENFCNGQFHDTVYVTANPFAERLPPDTFYAVESVLNCWDDELETVLPEDVVAAAIDAHESYPNKRLIVHFMQPHSPWIGPTADRLRDQFYLSGFGKTMDGDHKETNRSAKTAVDAIQSGEISRSEMKTAYRETLDIVLEHVSELLPRVPGKTVITADHGEHLGEPLLPYSLKKWGHPSQTYTPELRLVPWHEIEVEERRRTHAEPPLEGERVDEDVVNDRLQSLGYAPE